MKDERVATKRLIGLALACLLVVIGLAAGTPKKEQDTVAAGLERGEKLFNSLGCANCHPKGDTTGGKVSMGDKEIPTPSLRGAAAHFPTVKGPKKMLLTLGQMNNMCLQMMLKKDPLEHDSQEYVDLALYVTSLSEDSPIKLPKPPATPAPEVKKQEPKEKPVASIGKNLFETKCKTCHGLAKPQIYIGKKPADWWTTTVKRMKSKGAPGNITDRDATLIAEYLGAQSAEK